MYVRYETVTEVEKKDELTSTWVALGEVFAGVADGVEEEETDETEGCIQRCQRKTFKGVDDDLVSSGTGAMGYIRQSRKDPIE